MNRVIIALALILFSSSTFAQELKKTDYEAYYLDGAIYAQSMGFEDSIKNNYEVLKKIERLKGAEIEEVKDLLIRRINGTLNTLGCMIEDIEKGEILSSHFYEFQIKEDSSNRTFSESLSETNKIIDEYKSTFMPSKYNSSVEILVSKEGRNFSDYKDMSLLASIL